MQRCTTLSHRVNSPPDAPLISHPKAMVMLILQAILGIATFVALAWLASHDRARVRWRLVGVAFAAQLMLALLFTQVPGAQQVLLWLNVVVTALEQATLEATQFLFGFLAGAPAPYEVAHPEHNVVIALRVLPLIMVVSALSSVLFHLGILPRLIGVMAKVIQKLFKVSGPLAFAAAASVFLGIIESPLVIRPYLARMRRDELFATMVCGMSTVAGTVMVLYASVLEGAVPGALGHVVIASVISVPAALGLAHVMEPGDPDHAPTPVTFKPQTTSTMEALIEGTLDGLKMVVHIAAIIIVLFALVNLINKGLGVFPQWGDAPVTLQRALGVVLRPVMWLTGIEWSQTHVAGELFATKLILNEFVAYLQFGELTQSMDARTRRIMMYAMCGFANVGSLGILVGGLGSILPERRAEIIELGTRAVLAGALATLTTGAIIGMLS